MSKTSWFHIMCKIILCFKLSFFFNKAFNLFYLKCFLLTFEIPVIAFIIRKTQSDKEAFFVQNFHDIMEYLWVSLFGLINN